MCSAVWLRVMPVRCPRVPADAVAFVIDAATRVVSPWCRSAKACEVIVRLVRRRLPNGDKPAKGPFRYCAWRFGQPAVRLVPQRAKLARDAHVRLPRAAEPHRTRSDPDGASRLQTSAAGAERSCPEC